jgi:drug/metabolite transporter (DMT)-like permease
MSLFMDERPEKKLAITSFAMHSARGLIRDQKMRRNTMFFLLLVALVLLFCGSTFLRRILNPHEHPVWFILFWFICIWLTFTAFLLAIFDILLVRIQARKAEKILRAGLGQNPDSPARQNDE